MGLAFNPKHLPPMARSPFPQTFQFSLSKATAVAAVAAAEALESSAVAETQPEAVVVAEASRPLRRSFRLPREHPSLRGNPGPYWSAQAVQGVREAAAIFSREPTAVTASQALSLTRADLSLPRSSARLVDKGVDRVLRLQPAEEARVSPMHLPIPSTEG